MKKIIKNGFPSIWGLVVFAGKKLFSAVKTTLVEEWNMVIGYLVACSLAVIFLTVWPFDWLVFLVSLMYGVSFLRLKGANVPIERNSIVIMWCIFCFGLSGTLMQLLAIDGIYLISIFISGLAVVLLYVYIPKLSYCFKFNNLSAGEEFYYSDTKKHYTTRMTKYNGFALCAFIAILGLIPVGCRDKNRLDNKEEQKLTQQLNNMPFVSVEQITTETYHGNTYYIVDAGGKKFCVSPFQHPEVRNIKKNSQIKVILENYSSEGLKRAKKLQVKK